MKIETPNYTFLYTYGREKITTDLEDPSLAELVRSVKSHLLAVGFQQGSLDEYFYSDGVCRDCMESARKDWEDEKTTS